MQNDDRLNVVPLNRSDDTEPEWTKVGIHGCDFRPHFDGYLYNLFTTIRPLQTQLETEKLFRRITIEIAKWILLNREQFGHGDRFQLIVGWPLDVRATGRQVIKTGGDYNSIQRLIDCPEQIQLRDRWAESVFPNHEIG